MLFNKKIAVVVPAYNEEKQIGMVIETMPAFVDRIVIINDCSKDSTADVILRHMEQDHTNPVDVTPQSSAIQRTLHNEAEVILHESEKKELKYFPPCDIVQERHSRIVLINQLKNSGNGVGIARGLKWTKDHQFDCAAVMDGDGQMDPAELESIVTPIVKDEVDYVKGNRLIHRSAWLVIPKIRYFGNSILAILTKIASGYWRVSDTQCGFIALSLRAMQSLRIHQIYRRYGWPNDLLVKLNIAYCTLREVEIKPVYHIGEKSKMKIHKIIPKISWLLLKSFFKRLWIKYLFRDFHPLFLLYNFSFILGLLLIPYIAKIIYLSIYGQSISFETLAMFLFLSTAGFQSLFFAMFMDIQDNERLYK
jgi:glycosyltransferase involved in cell wall biosynthesis